MKQTAVEWLQEALSLTFEQQMQYEGLFQQAKEMENKEQDKFAIGFAEWRVNDWVHDERWTKISDTKELLEIYKKEINLL